MRSAFAVSVLISFSLLLSKMSGLFREAILASKLGATATADAFILILTLPDFMVGLLLSGGISAALLPLLKQSEGVRRFSLLRSAAFIITSLFVLLALILSIFAEFFIRLFLPLVNFSAQPDFIIGFNVSMIALPIAALIGVSASYLQTIGRFIVPSLSVLVFNCAICIYLLLFSNNEHGLISFGTVVLIAALLRLSFQSIFMLDALKPLPSRPSPLPKRFIQRFIAGAFGFSVITSAVFIFRSLHALNGEGYMTTFNYAHKLFQLPTGFLVGPITIVLLQILSGINNSDKRSFGTHAYSGMLAGLNLACIAAVLGWLYMPIVVRIIFGHGVMTTAECLDITNVARSIFIALPFYALLHIGAIALNVQGRQKLFALNSFVGLTAGVLLCLTCIYFGWQHYAAAIGFAFFNLVSATLCVVNIFGCIGDNLDLPARHQYRTQIN